jgi:uncharacterized protein (TIGR03382 family)
VLTPVLFSLLLSVEGIGSGTVQLTKGQVKVTASSPTLGDYLAYTLNAPWTLDCNCGTSCGSAYKSLYIGHLDETGAVQNDYWSGVRLVSASSSSGIESHDFEPGMVYRARLEGSGCIPAPVLSETVALPPNAMAVSMYITQDKRIVKCLQTGVPVYPLLSVQAKLNPGETIAFHYLGSGVDHVQTFDKTTFNNTDLFYYVTATSPGPVDVWAVHSTAGESNHLTIQAAADGCVSDGSDTDAGSDPAPTTKNKGGCSATGASLVLPAALLLAALRRRRQRSIQGPA